MLGDRRGVVAMFIIAGVSALPACHRPHAPTPHAAVALYAKALRNDDPHAAYALLSAALQARTPYGEFAKRWHDQAAERAAQLQAISGDLQPALAPLVLTRSAVISTPASASATGPVQRAEFVKHGAYWYAGTPLLAATFYATPEAVLEALASALETPAVQTLVGVWTSDRQAELTQQLGIARTGLAAALASGTKANLVSDERAQFSFFAGDLWFLIALRREDGQWQIENIFSDNGVYPTP